MENPRSMPTTLSQYENQRRDWNMFGQYMRNHRPPLSLARYSGAHGSLDALIGRLCAAFEENEGKPESNPFGALPSDFTSAKSAIHSPKHRGSATRKRSGTHPITLPISAVRFKNPSDLGDGCRSNQMNLRKIRDSQSKARGISYEKKKRRPPYYSSDLGLAEGGAGGNGGGGISRKRRHGTITLTLMRTQTETCRLSFFPLSAQFSLVEHNDWVAAGTSVDMKRPFKSMKELDMDKVILDIIDKQTTVRVSMSHAFAIVFQVIPGLLVVPAIQVPSWSRITGAAPLETGVL
ncbi:hypothetical protein RJ640_000984, partial [Escallonia rubra]